MSEKQKNLGGRPTKYTQETAGKICDLIARGLSLRAVCAADDMPTVSTVCLWLNRNPEFSEQYAHAREEQADIFADEIVEIADNVIADSASVAKAKLQIDARKWKAAKLAPKKYGEKSENVTGMIAVKAYADLSDEQLAAELSKYGIKP